MSNLFLVMRVKLIKNPQSRQQEYKLNASEKGSEDRRVSDA